MKVCQICGKEFETIENGGSRKYCFDCTPNLKNLDTKTSEIRNAMKREAVKMFGGECIICGYKKYIGALEFHHIDESVKDFNPSASENWTAFLEELKKCVLLCSNCHREVHADESIISDVDMIDVYAKVDEKIALVKELSIKVTPTCKTCGAEITGKTSSGLCKTCASKEMRRADRPSKDELLVLIKENSFTKVGRMYGVSDNAIRGWCKSYGLPTKKSEIKLL